MRVAAVAVAGSTHGWPWLLLALTLGGVVGRGGALVRHARRATWFVATLVANDAVVVRVVAADVPVAVVAVRVDVAPARAVCGVQKP